jgi:hypothetical protein
LYSDRYSEDEKLLMEAFLRKTKMWNIAGGRNLKLTFCNIGYGK